MEEGVWMFSFAVEIFYFRADDTMPPHIFLSGLSLGWMDRSVGKLHKLFRASCLQQDSRMDIHDAVTLDSLSFVTIVIWFNIFDDEHVRDTRTSTALGLFGVVGARIYLPLLFSRTSHPLYSYYEE